MLFFQALPAPPPDTVAGTVLSERDQRPIPHATVTLYDEIAGSTTVSTLTDEAGHYQLPPAPAGRYSLSASAPGYLLASYLQHDVYSSAVILGAGLPTNPLTLTLAPAATISGSVTDDSDPIDSASIELYREDPTQPGHITTFRNIVTPRELFEFTSLPPGRYYLSASARPWYALQRVFTGPGDKLPYRPYINPALLTVYPTIFYPDALDSNAAQPIVLHAGEQYTANLRMKPQQPVSLSVRMPPAPEPASPPPAPRSNVPVEELLGEPDRGSITLSHMVFGVEETVPVELDAKDGTLIASQIPPGRYILSQSGPGNGSAVRISEVDLTGASTALTLSALKAQAKVAVTVHGLPAHSAPGPYGFVRFNNSKAPDDNGNQSGLDESLQANFPGLPPADYRIGISTENPEDSGSRDFHIEAVTVNGRLSPDKQLHITGAAKVAVVVKVADVNTKVQGTAQRAGKPFAGAMIVLVPAGQDAYSDLYRRDQSDLDGTFNLPNTEPGKYILIAIEDGWPLRWNDPVTLAPYLAHGVPITIPNTVARTFQITAPVQTTSR